MTSPVLDASLRTQLLNHADALVLRKTAHSDNASYSSMTATEARRCTEGRMTSP